MLRRKSRTFSDACKAAINEGWPKDQPVRLKWRLLVAMAINSEVRDLVEARFSEGAAAASFTLGDPSAQFDLDDFERLLQILIEYLPQIIEIFMGLL